MKNIILIMILFIVSLEAKNLEKVSLQLKWKYQFQFAGFIVAKEKGFYKDVGLDVDLKEFNDGVNIIKDVENGDTNFGISDSALIYEATKNKQVVAMMALFQDSPFILMGLKSSNINSIKDINGKKITLYEGEEELSIKAMLKSYNIKYIAKPLTFTLDKLVSKDIDLMSAYISNEPYVAKTKGIEVTAISPKDYGFEGYGDILFTSQQLLKSNPKLVEDFYKASYKGWEYAYSHMDEIVDMIYNKYNSLHKTKKALKYEALALKLLSQYGRENFLKLNIAKVRNIVGQFNLLKNENNKLKNLDSFIYKYNYVKPNIKYKYTKNEKEYLENRRDIKLCVQANKMPFSNIQNGKLVGMVSGYVDIFKQKLGVNFKVVKTNSLDESIKMLKTNRCDMISTIQSNKNIDGIKLTKDYIKSPLVLAIGSKVSFVSDFNNLQNKKIGLSKNLFLEKEIKKFYPNITLTKVDSLKEGLIKVGRKELFAQIGSLAQMTYLFEKDFRGELKVAGKSDDVNLCFSMGIPKENKILYEIMQKSIKNLDSSVRYNILNKWAVIKYDKVIPKNILLMIVFVILFLLVIIFTFIKKNKKLKDMQCQLNDLNDSLEQKVKDEVEKNREKDKQLFQQSRLAQMGEIISMIAHQWRQPLTAISATSSAINLKAKLNKLDNNTAIELSDKISKYSQHLSSTIDDFREFFKKQKKKKDITYNDLIHSVLDIIEISIANNNITLIKDLNSNVVFHTYVNELKQVLLNLTKNAEDILIEKEIKNRAITITTKGNILYVSDNGGGVPKDIIEKIFDPYFSTKTKKDGTGLGLYMSKIIVEKHCGGKLSVSNSDEGAVFKIELSEENND